MCLGVCPCRGRIDGLKQKFSELEELAAQRRRQLAEAAEAYQFYSDANEAESWLKEKRPLVSSTDCGSDEPGAASLLARHKDTVGEINAYQDDITALAAQADKLQKAGITSLSLSGAPEVAEVEEWAQESRLVPKEVWEDEPVERTEYRVVTEERKIPQVKALYPFQGQDMQVVKGEVSGEGDQAKAQHNGQIVFLMYFKSVPFHLDILSRCSSGEAVTDRSATLS